MLLLKNGTCNNGEFKFEVFMESMEGTVGAIIRAKADLSEYYKLELNPDIS
jgi:hypothetical protein